MFWKDDFTWYLGCIDDHYGSDRYHIVYDDDGMEEWIVLPSVSPVEGRVCCVGLFVSDIVRLVVVGESRGGRDVSRRKRLTQVCTLHRRWMST